MAGSSVKANCAGEAVSRGGRWKSVALSLAALAAGALLPLALAPFGLWPAMLASAAALHFVLRRTATLRGAFWRGWLFGVGKYGAGASWIYVAIHVYGAAPPPLAAALVAVFVAGMALFSGLVGVLYRPQPASGALEDAADFALAWVLVEWLLTWVLSGFPWLFAGYAFLDTPLAGYAPVGGVLLVSLAGVASAALLLATFRAWSPHGTSVARRRMTVALPFAVAVAIWVGGWLLQSVSWTTRGESRSVALVQGNLPQETRWTAQGVVAAADRYEALSATAWNRDIVVWPEVAIPDLQRRVAPLVEAMRQGAAGDLIHGAMIAERADGEIALYNAAVSSGGGEYRKRRLVPFGEYVPLQELLRGTIAFFDLPMSNFASGASEQPLLRAAGLDVATAICYEIAYPAAVAESARDAELIVTLSNDAWFGASIGPWQHLQIARMRALENGKFVLRATNNGVSAVIDEHGAVVASLPQFEARTLLAEVHATSGATPYGRHSGGVVAVIVGFVLGGLLLRLGRAARRAGLRTRGAGRNP